MITMKAALRNSATWRHGEFIDQVEGAQPPFWRAVRNALVAIVEEMQPVTA